MPLALWIIGSSVLDVINVTLPDARAGAAGTAAGWEPPVRGDFVGGIATVYEPDVVVLVSTPGLLPELVFPKPGPKRESAIAPAMVRSSGELLRLIT